MSGKKNKCTVVWKGEQVATELRDVMLAALLETGYEIAKIAQENAPIETGALRASARVTIGQPPDPNAVYEESKGQSGKKKISLPETPTTGDTTVYVSFSTPYARRLHEDLDWNPRDFRYLPGKKKKGKDALGRTRMLRRTAYSPPVGGSKYLEDAVMDIWPNFKHILDRVKNRRRRRGKSI